MWHRLRLKIPSLQAIRAKLEFKICKKTWKMAQTTRNLKTKSKEAPTLAIQLQKLISTFLTKLEAQKCCSLKKQSKCREPWLLQVFQKHRDDSQICASIRNLNKANRTGGLTTPKKNRGRTRKRGDSRLLYIQETNRYYLIKRKKRCGNFCETNLKVYLKSQLITSTPG